MSPHIDLDAFLREQDADPLTVTFAGKTFTAPAEIPWTAFSLAQELEGKDLKTEDAQRLISRIIDLFFGSGSWAFMEQNKIGMNSAMKIINALMDRISEDLPKDENPKAVAARKVLEKHSPSESQTPQPNSGSSKPTTAGSIRLGVAS